MSSFRKILLFISLLRIWPIFNTWVRHFRAQHWGISLQFSCKVSHLGHKDEIGVTLPQVN